MVICKAHLTEAYLEALSAWQAGENTTGISVVRYANLKNPTRLNFSSFLC